VVIDRGVTSKWYFVGTSPDDDEIVDERVV
jgi:hypothetical protein